MAGETKFAKIKRLVEEEKTKKMRGEARLVSLEEESARIFKQVEEELGRPVASIEEAEAIGEELKEAIETDLNRMVAILKEEGIEV